MSDASQGPGWWKASDDKWYAPEQHPDYQPPAAAPEPPPAAPTAPTAPTPPTYTPSAYTPPAAGAPYGAPPPGGPPFGSPPPGAPGMPGAAPTYPQPGYASTMPGGPVPPAEAKKGNGGKIAVIAVIVLLLLGIAGAGAAILAGGDDDDDVASGPATTTTADDGKSESTPRTLVERTTTTVGADDPGMPTDDFGFGAFGDIDDETALCVGEAALADPELSDALASDDMDPTSPSFITLMEIIVDCGGRDYLEENFMGGVEEGGDLSQAQADCVSDTVSSLTDDEFLDLVVRLANEDLAAAEELFADCI